MKNDSSTAVAVSAGTGSGEISQLPWSVGDDRSTTISILSRAGTSHSNYVAMVNYRGNGFRERIEQEANAAFIVKACNAHHDMKEALQGLVDSLKQHDGVFAWASDPKTAELWAAARTALSKSGA